jgi:Tfp pilus assembly protein PilP
MPNSLLAADAVSVTLRLGQWVAQNDGRIASSK